MTGGFLKEMDTERGLSTEGRDAPTRQVHGFWVSCEEEILIIPPQTRFMIGVGGRLREINMIIFVPPLPSEFFPLLNGFLTSTFHFVRCVVSLELRLFLLLSTLS